MDLGQAGGLGHGGSGDRQRGQAAPAHGSTTGVATPRRALAATRTEELRQMVLLLETAEVLETRAQRNSDPRQVAVLRRRADQRRRQAAGIRARLAAQGIVLGGPAPRHA